MKKKILLILIVFGLFAQYSISQEAKYKASFTLSFIRYIGWPEASTKGDFVIGVLRNTEIADMLKAQASGKKFGFQDVIIKEFKNVEEITACQVIFISSNINFSRNASQIMQKIGENALIIGENEGAINYGAMINFVIREDKLKFEISKSNASKAGLQISSKLGTMASAINL